MITPSQEFLQAIKETERNETVQEALSVLASQWNSMTQEQHQQISSVLAGK